MDPMFPVPWPSYYHKLKESSFGICGTVSYAVPKADWDSAQAGGYSAAEVIKKTAGMICVIKQYSQFRAKRGDLTREIMLLNIVRTKQEFHHRFSNRVCRLIGADFNKYSWVSTKAVLGPSLKDAVQDWKPSGPSGVPDVFWFHVFVQAMEALRFLHGQSISIIHGDFSEENLVLDFEHRDFPWMPNLVLTGFNGGGSTGSPTLSNWEDIMPIWKFWRASASVMSKPRLNDGFADFMDVAWNEFNRPCAEHKRDYITAEGLKINHIWELLGYTAVARRERFSKMLTQIAKVKIGLGGFSSGHQWLDAQIHGTAVSMNEQRSEPRGLKLRSLFQIFNVDL